MAWRTCARPRTSSGPTSPPLAIFRPKESALAAYILAGEEFTLSKDGVSEISYADYVIAMVDEIERGENGHIGERISVVRR